MNPEEYDVELDNQEHIEDIDEFMKSLKIELKYFLRVSLPPNMKELPQPKPRTSYHLRAKIKTQLSNGKKLVMEWIIKEEKRMK